MVQSPRPGYDRHLVALEEVLQTLRDQQRIDRLVETTSQFLHKEFNYPLVWIAVYLREEHMLVGQGGVSEKDHSFLKQKVSLFPGDLLDQVLVQQRPASVPDLREERRAGEWRKFAQKHRIQGTLIHPIRYREECLGLVLLGSEQWGGFLRGEQMSCLSILLGGLGASLSQLVTEQQRQKQKRPDEPLLALIAQLNSLPSFQQRSLTVVQETQQFINSARTSIWWFEPEQNLFRRRVTNQSKTSRDQPQTIPEISAQEISGFCQALSAGQSVAVSEMQSTIANSAPLRLMRQLKVQSFLAAPLLVQERLVGFLAVEDGPPRLWQEAERNYLQAAAQLLALTVPQDKTEQTIQPIQQDQGLSPGFTRPIYSEQDWRDTLRLAAEQLSKSLQVPRVVLLLCDPDTGKFSVGFQNQGVKLRPLGESLKPLSDVDWQMLERSTGAITIDNWSDDLRLLAWRETFLNLGVKSLLVCSTALGRPLEGLLLLGHESVRGWTSTERQMVESVAQQLGLIVHQWQLQRQSEQQQKIHTSVQQGLMAIQKTQNLERLEQTALNDLMQVLQVPLAALVTWSPGQNQGRIVVPPEIHPKFAVQAEVLVPIDRDELIQTALTRSRDRDPIDQYSSLVKLSVQELAPDTRHWLCGSDVGQIIAIALQTDPEYEASGVVLVVDRLERHWTALQLSALVTLLNHFAWAHRAISLTQLLKQEWQNLESLNWYKQRRLEDWCRQLTFCSRQMNELVQQKSLLAIDTLGQRLAHQLEAMVSTMSALAQRESWQLHIQPDSIPLATLLKRLLDRIEPLLKKQQIWYQVHNQRNLTISGDIHKIDLALYELLLAACHRVTPGGRIDLWCQPLEQDWFELSITDDGTIDPRLLIDLHHYEHLDLLAPSTLDQPPGRHLKICQSLLQQLGGQMDMFRLEDGRVLSRLILPLVPPAVRGDR
uniref:Putative GAF sensor protein n=1 Tax=Cyanothece sp. (strain PCC 7425 / ATCC 29141) TaxID=395961 RepID=B8HTH7_CYAP4